MSLVAGIDVGNATTEVVLARVTDRVDVVAAGRAPTRRTKGSPESLAGAAALVRRLERQHGVRVEHAVAAPLRPVATERISLPEAAPETGRLWLAGTGSATAGGSGAGVGRPVVVGDRIAGDEPVVLVAPSGTGYRAVVAAAAPLAAAGRLAAVLVEDDEAVLVANRLAGAVPVVDEVAARPVLGADLVAVEVSTDGRPLRTLTDPLRLAAALRLPEDEVPDAARLTPLLFDAGNAVVALGGAPPSSGPDAQPWLEIRDGNRPEFLDGIARVATGPVGLARAYAVPPELEPRAVDDLWAVDLAAVAASVRARREGARARPVALAALDASAPLADPSEQLAALLGVPVLVAGEEPAAARAGALSTPGATGDSVVVDLGGGTVDAVSAGGAVVAAGAGDLLASAVAELTGVTSAAAEWVKRGPAHRVEAPQVLLGEDGRRSFLDRPAAADTVGSLVVQGPAGVLAFSRTLSPGEWRALRLAVKVELLGGNVARALRTLGTAPATVVVVGGLAGDDEILAAVSGALPAGTAVGRGDVAGTLGHRYAVAYGLMLLAAR